MFGGGLRAVAQDLTIKDSTIAQNAASEGGGITWSALFDVPHTADRVLDDLGQLGR